jgi:hypothetical protein
MTVSGHGGTSSHFGKIEANTRCGCESAVESADLTTEEWVARRVSACDRAIALGGTSTKYIHRVLTLWRLARPGMGGRWGFCPTGHRAP